MLRRALPVCVLLLALVPQGAGAAELYAAPGAGGVAPCTVAGAPCTLRDAIVAARTSAGADTIHLTPGSYSEQISATNEADTDVTFAGSGMDVTILAGVTVDGPMVELGSGGGTMTLRDLTIDSSASGPLGGALRDRLASLTLQRVHVINNGVAAKQSPAIDADASYATLALDGVLVESSTQTGDAAIGAVTAGGPLTIRDSTISHSSLLASSAVYARGPTVVQRSTIQHGDANAGSALRIVNAATPLAISIDSSILRGGQTAIRLDLGPPATTLALRGVTLAPFAGTGASGFGLDIQSPSASTAAATIDSSLLLDRGIRQSNVTPTTCRYTNISTGSTATCPTTTANASANTKLTTAALTLDASSLAPLAGSPAIDSGNPAGAAAGESPTDRLARLRAASSADVCDAGAGIRDKGAYERYRPAPTAAVDAPASAVVATPVSFTAASNARSPLFAWTYSDGTSGASGVVDAHSFAALGNASVTLTVTDAAFGCATSATRGLTITKTPPPPPGTTPPATDRTAPTLRKLSVGEIDRRHRTAALRLTLSESATLRVTVGRQARGRLTQGRCSARAKRGKRCTRVVAPRTLTVKVAKAGAVRVTLSARKLHLRRGRYTVSVVARDGAGNASKTARVVLRVR